MKQAATLTEKQLKLVLAHCATRKHAARDRAIVQVSFLAALRAKEIAALTIENVRADDGSIREEFVLSAEQSKGQRARRVFLSTKLRKELAAYLATAKLRRTCSALFQSQKGRAFSPNTMCQLFMDIYRQCGIEGASSHSGRRTALSAMVDKAINIKIIATIAGHSDIRTTSRYLSVTDKQLRNAIELV